MQNLNIAQPRLALRTLSNTLRLILAGLVCVIGINPAYAVTDESNAKSSNAAATEMAVNINAADASTLAERLVGIGLRRAEAIVEYRDAHGKFQDPYELVAVKGVGEAIVSKNESRILLHD